MTLNHLEAGQSSAFRNFGVIALAFPKNTFDFDLEDIIFLKLYHVHKTTRKTI